MASKFVQDIRNMHEKFGVREWVMKNPEKRKELLDFRMEMLREEYKETVAAYVIADDEEIVDGLIDLMVIAIGTLEMFEVNIDEAWNEVMRANMSKEVGVKQERPNPLGLPDLIKPKDWDEPFHLDNTGTLIYALQDD